jgi:hypothetical protein
VQDVGPRLPAWHDLSLRTRPAQRGVTDLSGLKILGGQSGLIDDKLDGKGLESCSFSLRCTPMLQVVA